MARRSPARYLAPLALVAVCAALFAVVSSTTGNGDGGSTTNGRPAASPDNAEGSPARQRRRRVRKFYVVRAGDTPGAIAERTGVPLAEIERLNPDIDPQQLSPGQRLRLRR
jgi:LysM repeat protein